MERQEFIQECVLRLVDKLQGADICESGGSVIYEFASGLASQIYGSTEGKYGARMEEIDKAELERKQIRLDELKGMPKYTVLFFVEFRYRSWPDKNGNIARCYIKSSVIKDRSDIVNYVKKGINLDYEYGIDYITFEYCYITEDFAESLLKAGKSANRSSKELDYIKDYSDWVRLCEKNDMYRTIEHPSEW